MLIAVFQAIGKVRDLIIWKPGKADSHLVKRVRLGHLPDDATLEQYNTIIAFVVNNPDANIYLYAYGETIYPTLVANVENHLWLVMIGLDGVLETAFPPDDPEGYLSNSAFIYLGSVKELEI
ncbi:hypothetical protein [Planktothrix paucivesiculata]|uniref:Uncharacterized protein n=1 Tax=Planktothrix paucivesiculata PCC 9631 TaxID=671071 RepID=A0A7Z9DWC4_9CYAN|nr:hypothetical protein [Planktothrix paucivesiculata]VXD12003.1 conserved hypothetical protein [Planktothrix paucivesiculata PCC 9631]